MHVGAEGLIALAGAVFFAVGFPILIFKDTFDLAKKPTSIEVASEWVAVMGLIYFAVALAMTGSGILLSAPN